MFGTVHQKPNQFIDLLNGQRYTYLSRKDVDTQSYKTFYQVKIQTLQQYLVAVKIGMIRYKQCCNGNDFIVWRVNVSNQDQFSRQKTISTGNIVICQQGNRNLEAFMRQLGNLVQKSNNSNQQQQSQQQQSVNNNTNTNSNNNNNTTNNNNKVTDHGSLFSCLQMYLRNSKISIIQCLMNDYDQIETHLQQIKHIPLMFMNKNMHYKVNQQPMQLNAFIQEVEQIAKISKQHQSTTIQTAQTTSTTTTLKKLTTYLTSLTSKQTQKFKQLHFAFKQFIKQSIDKLQIFIKLFKHCQQVRQEFYTREKFPVGIEIKQLDDIPFTMKTFYIAKIYSLSEKYQMANLQNTCQKMMTIKNQLEIAIKTLMGIVAKSSKKLYNTDSFSLGKSYVFIATPRKKNREIDESIIEGEKQVSKYEKILKQLKSHLQKVRKHLKYILNLNPRYLHDQNHKQTQKKSKQQSKFHQIITHQSQSQQLDNMNFQALMGQQLFNEIEKYLKNLGYNNTNNKSKKQQKQNRSLSIIRRSDAVDNLIQNQQQNDSLNNRPQNTNSKSTNKKTVLFNQRQQKSITQTISNNNKNNNTLSIPLSSGGDNSILDISAISTARIQRTKRLFKQSQSLEKSLMEIKQSQIQKHLEIKKGISLFQQQISKDIQEPPNQRQGENDSTTTNNVLHQRKKTLHLVKKSSHKLLKKMTVEKQNGSISMLSKHNHHQNQTQNNESNIATKKRKQKYAKSQTINTTVSNQYNQPSINTYQKQQHHSRHESTPSSFHLQGKIIRKNYHSIVQINNNNNQTILNLNNTNQSKILLPQISKSADKYINITTINNHMVKNVKSSSPKLKKKHLIKVVKNSVHDQMVACGKGQRVNINSKINNQHQQSKSFFPDISLVCRKINC